MNARRAANRDRSRQSGGETDAMRYDSSEGERHETMRGRRIPHREPEHHEEGGNYRHEAHASHNSPASRGASKGPGPLPGAGELPGKGPGAASRRIRGNDPGITPMDSAPGGTPRGMTTYKEE